MKRKKILFHSNHSKAFTGFGKNLKNILIELSKRGKYEIVEYANGIPADHPELQNMPWKTLGSLPNDPQRMNQINKDPNTARLAGYGHELIDKAIRDEKPDIYVGAEDIWAFDGFTKKNWWNKINCMIWTTLDSQPILPSAIDAAPKIKNYFIWSSFGQKDLNKLGFDHVKTLHGSLQCDSFFRLPDQDRLNLRAIQGIPQDAFIVGFVFRNQLRKSVPNLLDGYKEFCSQNPSAKAYLLLHTHWKEGWDIPRLIKEKDIDGSKILTTYFCQKCRRYEIKPYAGEGLDCRFCGTQKSQQTVNIRAGVSERQLNEVYNLMDVYCHPFTSGGQEIPVQEAKLTELITLVTNYSCGEDSCGHESAGLPLDWAEYREPGTQFIKASTYPSSIAKQLKRVYKMPLSKRLQKGSIARKYVVDNYSVDSIVDRLEDIFEKMPDHDFDFNFESKLLNANYTPLNTEDNSKWLIDIYKNILDMEVDPKYDQGYQYWMSEFEKGAQREGILSYFRKTALEQNNKTSPPKIEVEDLFKDSQKKRALFVLPGKGGDVFNATSLLESFHENYSGFDVFFCCDPKYFPILACNPHIYKLIKYENFFDNELALIGRANNKKIVDFYCNLNIATDRSVSYISNPAKGLNLYLNE